MNPGLRSDDLPLDAGQELLALGQAQTQGAQIGKGVGLGDPHDIGAVFFARSSDADQPHDPGHVASTSAGIQARKYLFRSRAPNLAAVPPPRRCPAHTNRRTDHQEQDPPGRRFARFYNQYTLEAASPGLAKVSVLAAAVGAEAG